MSRLRGIECVRRVRLTYALIVAAWFAAASLSPAFAQIAAGEITGIITDQSGMPVPGATCPEAR